MLENKTILLTGANGGIGSELAKLLVAEGAKLVLVGLEEISLQLLNAELGGRHQVIEADISNANDRQRIVNSCQALESSIDIVINNAGIGQFSLLQNMNEDQVAAIININLTSTILLTQSLLPLLLAQPTTQIINIGSILGSIGLPGSTVYCASKFAIRGFSEALRRELSDTKISVRYFAPRATKTAINDHKVTALNKELGTKMDSASYVASELVSFLKENKASRNVGWPEKLFVKLNGLLPSVIDNSISKQLPIFKHYLKG